jgi:cold shock CspA family protein
MNVDMKGEQTFGWLSCSDGAVGRHERIFCHVKDVAGGERLPIGTRVRFRLEDTGRGPRAFDVCAAERSQYWTGRSRLKSSSMAGEGVREAEGGRRHRESYREAEVVITGYLRAGRVGGPSAVRIATVTAPAYVGRVTGRAGRDQESWRC